MLFDDDGPTGPTSAVPGAGATWAEVTQAAGGCRECPLWRDATVTVFGEGPVPAEVMLVGEQPGDNEDQRGRPFVGPAGAVLDEALAEAGFDRSATYVTNAVKHFKFTTRGKRRIHQTPQRSEVLACRPWVERELALVQPRLLVLLGATAAKGELGPKFRLTTERGRPLDSDRAEFVVATVHPSSILRALPEQRGPAREAFVADLVAARRLLG